jgi:hypothetical protein
MVAEEAVNFLYDLSEESSNAMQLLKVIESILDCVL